MKFTHYLFGAVFCLSLVACGDNDKTVKTDPSTEDKPDKVVVPERLLPLSVSQIPAKPNDPNDAPQGVSASHDAPDTEFSAFEPRLMGVQVPGSEVFQNTNYILCFISQLKPEDNIDKEVYVALVNEKTCAKQSGQVGDFPSLTHVTTKTEKTDTGYSVYALWGNNGVMRIRFDITTPDSSPDSAGSFKMYMTRDAINNSPKIFGHLSITPEGNNLVFKYSDSFGGSNQLAGKSSKDGQTGENLIRRNGQPLMATTYNSDFVKIKSQQDQCLKRDDPEENVLGYALFTETDGKLKQLTSGISFTYDDNGEKKHGYIAKHSHWFEGDDPATGSTVTGIDGKSYVIDESGGKYSLQNSEGEPVKLDDAIVFLDVDLNGPNDDLTDRAGNPLPAVTKNFVYGGLGTMGLYSDEDPKQIINLPDAYTLTDASKAAESTTYIVKAATIQHKLKTQATLACENVTVPTLTADDLVSIDDVKGFPEASDLSKSSLPPKYIAGKKVTPLT